MDPVSAVLGGLSFGGSLFNSIFGNNQQMRMMKMQRQENALNRQFNHDEAELNRSFQMDVLHQQQDYNSASSQVQRLQEAGLNPALAYGQIGDMSASSPAGAQASASGGLSPLVYQGFDPMSLTQASLLAAQTENVKEDTNNKKFQGTILESDAKYRDALNQGNLDVMGINIAFTGGQIEWTKQEIAESKARVQNLAELNDKLQQETANLKKQWDILDEQARIAAIDRFFKSETFDDEVRKVKAAADLAEDEARVFLTRAFAEVANIQADTLDKTRHAELLNEEKYKVHYETGVILPKQASLIQVTKDGLDFKLSQDKKFEPVERTFKLGETLLNATLNTITTFEGIINNRVNTLVNVAKVAK